MRKELQSTGLWIDNSSITIDQTVDLILEHVLAQGVIVDSWLSTTLRADPCSGFDQLGV